MSKKKSKSAQPEIHPMQAEIIETIKLAKGKAIDAKRKTQAADQKLQTIIDEADVTIPLVLNLKPTNLESVKGIWNSVAEQVSDLDDNLKYLNLNINSTTGSSSTSTAVLSGYFVNDGYMDVESPEFVDAWSNFEAFASRPSLKDEVVQLFAEFGFDVPQVPGDKSPAEQFHIAHMSFENPIAEGNPVVASLLPLRECIDAVVASLLRMRPQQERAKSQRDKIVSIGNQLKKNSFPQTVVDELGDEWHSLYNDLSGMKKKDITRSGWLSQLNRGTSFLYGLLNGLDQSKLRR